MDIAWNGTNVLNHNIGSVGIQSLSKFLPLSNEDFTNFFGLYYINVPLSSTANMKKLVELYMLDIFNSDRVLANKIFVDQNTSPLNEFVYSKVKDKLFLNERRSLLSVNYQRNCDMIVVRFYLKII